jgi:hypothetical protein
MHAALLLGDSFKMRLDPVFSHGSMDRLPGFDLFTPSPV